MKKEKTLPKSAKYIVVVVFLILSIISLLCMGGIKINYNISDYLDEATDTKISLGIMEKEFGLISNVQVMVRDVTPDEADEIKAKIKSIENVIFVNFSEHNTDYYKDGTALFVVLLSGNEYSDSAKNALADIEEALTEDYSGRLEIGGTVMEKKLLRAAIQSEILLILAISVCLVALLMLITSASWIEPLVLLAASGVAVLLNMGSNILFGEISYITNAIAAILQLALSIDYSIVLLHSYRSKREHFESRESAMLMAIKEVARPVSASALTTIAGLLALLFMSFTIGFDIGSVLMKSIVISAITSLTLLPALLLIFDGLMARTAKKPFKIKSDGILNVSLKFGKAIVPIAIILIVICCVLNLSNRYNFVDSCNKNEEITDTFGDSGTLIVLFENCDDSEEKERLLTDLLNSYKKSDGSPVLKSSVSYSGTVGQVFDVEKASRDLGLSMDDATLLFTIYRFTEDGAVVKMTTRTFLDFAIELMENDDDAKDFVSEDTAKMLDTLLGLDSLLSGEYTAGELYEAISDIEMLEGMSLDLDSINLLYGTKYYSSMADKTANFGSMLDFLIDSGTLDADLSNNLKRLPETYKLIKGLNIDLTPPDEMIGYSDLGGLVDKYGLDVDDQKVNYIWYYELKKGPKDTMTFEELFTFLTSNDKYLSKFPEKLITALDTLGSYDYRYVYETKEAFDKTFARNYAPKDFMPALLDLVEQATGNRPEITLDQKMNEQLEMVYVMYFIDEGKIPDQKIGCIDFLKYVLELSKTNSVIAERLPEGASDRLQGLISDAEGLNLFLSDKTEYDYLEMKERIGEFAESVTSMEVSLSLGDAAIMGLFVKYSGANGVIETGEISATDLLNFVMDAAENNELLKGRITDDMRRTIAESRDNMASAETLLRAQNYSRMLLTVNLPPESPESSAFVEYLSARVEEIFGQGAYVAGEIATTNDLIKAFDDDNRLISIFTVVSIFLIIMVVFKSLSLPIILVAIIQGAIWIAMSMSLLGSSMFFMSYIMSMCILMGATIDYGILLSTSYVTARETSDRREAIRQALDAALPTVFTSGLILMICGLVVGLIASQTSISSVGFLLFRGTLVSTVMITLVLPALLYMLDKFVIKLTIKSKTK